MNNNIVANSIVANTLNVLSINGVNFNMDDDVNYDFNSCNCLNNEGITGVGFTGTNGPQGLQGLTGAQGIQGIAGTNGVKGDTGAKGSTGAQGIQGVAGTQGPTGSQGIQGVAGQATTFTLANNNMKPYSVLYVSESTKLSFPLEQIIVVKNLTMSININLPLINSSHEGLTFQFISCSNNNTITLICDPINKIIQLSNMSIFSKMTIPSTNALLYCILLIPNTTNYAWYQIANT
jgi:hypothetical protein